MYLCGTDVFVETHKQKVVHYTKAGHLSEEKASNYSARQGLQACYHNESINARYLLGELREWEHDYIDQMLTELNVCPL